jgi:hypothetical protein
MIVDVGVFIVVALHRAAGSRSYGRQDARRYELEAALCCRYG